MYDNTYREFEVLTPAIVSEFKYEAFPGDHLPWGTEYLWWDADGSLKMGKVAGKSGWVVKAYPHDRVWVRFRPKPVVPKDLGSVVYHGEALSASGTVWKFHHAVKVRESGPVTWGVFGSTNTSIIDSNEDLIMWCGDEHFISFKVGLKIKEDS